MNACEENALFSFWEQCGDSVSFPRLSCSALHADAQIFASVDLMWATPENGTWAFWRAYFLGRYFSVSQMHQRYKSRGFRSVICEHVHSSRGRWHNSVTVIYKVYTGLILYPCRGMFTRCVQPYQQYVVFTGACWVVWVVIAQHSIRFSVPLRIFIVTGYQCTCSG